MKMLVLVGLILSSVAFAETAQVESVDTIEAMDVPAQRCEARSSDGAIGVGVSPNVFIAQDIAIRYCMNKSFYPDSCMIVGCVNTIY
ncbi:hypothetical protein [Peredibacter starrii]|uniref:Uncharacterized protein n=1 Tax=Peredibacter starrii TaxID=28202 RepID=A0AAX4HUK6_9BACT|nr:hypothetical protein [Peredibacter starrii]WPU67078.1 hypothetical protein SOO65_09965 [Peredibacter starrii]